MTPAQIGVESVNAAERGEGHEYPFLLNQGFSLLTANREALAHPELAQIAQRQGRTVSQIVFRFALEVGIVPLTGTTDALHMQADLEVFDFSLDRDEVEQIERLVAR